MIELDINWNLIVSHMFDLGVAYLLALPIAWDRERNERSAGLRTFPLTAIAACGYTLISMDIFDSPEAQARVTEGLITGIGFIGGGAILKSKMQITGTATAAGLWATGVIGLAVAYDRTEIAIVISIVTFLTLSFMGGVRSQTSSAEPPRHASHEAQDDQRE